MQQYFLSAANSILFAKIKTEDAQIAKILRIAKYQVVLNIRAQLYADMNTGTKSKYWKEVMSLPAPQEIYSSICDLEFPCLQQPAPKFSF